VYCNRSCLFVCLWLCGSVTTITRNYCIDLHQTGSVGEIVTISIQLIKFWPSRAPGKGVCGGAKMFASALLQPARSVCVSPSAFLFSENSAHAGPFWTHCIYRSNQASRVFIATGVATVYGGWASKFGVTALVTKLDTDVGYLGHSTRRCIEAKRSKVRVTVSSVKIT